MKEDESINTEELRNQIERLIAGGVHGIFPFGTNGEGYILSETEKVEVLETTIDQVKGRVPVYAGSGCISTADTIRMSKKAEELGADVLSIKMCIRDSHRVLLLMPRRLAVFSLFPCSSARTHCMI